MRDVSFVILLAFVTLPLSLRAQSKIHPATEITLHNHAEWRIDAQIVFDPIGRLLILYRDNSKLNANDHWHLIRLTDPQSGKPRSEEITFSIPREPTGPTANRWDNFHDSLLLSPDGNYAYAAFNGAIVTAKPGLPPATGGRNVRIDPFSSVISFDLIAFKLLASADVTQHPTNSNVHLLDDQGNLLLLHPTDADWSVQVLDRFLHEVKTVTISMGPGKSRRFNCYLRPDLKMECPSYGEGDLLFTSQLTVQLPHSTCKMRQETVALGFGKDVTLDDERLIKSDRLCTRDKSGKTKLVSPDLLPRCHQGWQPEATSPDHLYLLTSCVEPGSFLDAYFYVSSISLQLVDAITLAPRTTIALTRRHRLAYGVFHQAGATTIAVLEDGVKLQLYHWRDEKKPPASGG